MIIQLDEVLVEWDDNKNKHNKEKYGKGYLLWKIQIIN